MSGVGTQSEGGENLLDLNGVFLERQHPCAGRARLPGRRQGSLNGRYPDSFQRFIQKGWLGGKLPTSKSKQAQCPNEGRGKNDFLYPGKALWHPKPFRGVQYLFEALVECHKGALRALHISAITEITF